jgi:hypothetical protein
MRRFFALGLLAAVSVLALAAFPGCGDESDDGGGGNSSESASGGGGKKGGDEASDCGFKATDDCTPHVGPNGKVRGDALIYRLRIQVPHLG